MRVIFTLFLFSLTLFSGEVNSPEVCPITEKDFNYYSNQKVEVSIPSKFVLGKNDINIKLDELNYPSGYNVVAFIDVEESSSKSEPEIENGIPTSSITFHENGTYELLLNVNLIYRSS